MTLRLRVHVDDDGNAVVPIGRMLHGRDVELHIDVMADTTATPSPDESSKDAFADEQWDQLTALSKKDFVPASQRPPRVFTPAEQAERMRQFDALTGAWQGDFPEPADPPAEPGIVL